MLATLGVLALLAGAVWLVWKLPSALYLYVPDPKDRAGPEATTRTGLIAALAGLAALGSLAVTTRTYRLSLQGQLTDRYTKAVAQLGDDKLDIRLGGIYALERLAVDSKRDHPTVVEVLSAYVRERTRARAGPRTRPPGRRTAYPIGLTSAPGPLGVDIQAALTVLGRLPMRVGVSRADLSGSNLTGAELSGANLTKARLRGANLTNARLARASLTKALLTDANLTNAWLGAANLTEAGLTEANLNNAGLDSANLTKARLYGANLTNASLHGANLSEARLSVITMAPASGGIPTTINIYGVVREARVIRADLTGAVLARANLTEASFIEASLAKVVFARADLTRAMLDGADLTGAVGLEQKQLDSAWGDLDTVLPDGLTRPAAWTSPNEPSGPDP